MGFLDFKKCFTYPSHFFKLIILMVCGCFTLYQLSQCINKLQHPPVSTFYKFCLNDSIKYPSITICRKPAYHTKVFEKFGLKSYLELDTANSFGGFKFDQYTLEDFLKEATFTFDEIFQLFSYRGNTQNLDNSLEIRSEYYLTRGKCYTLTPKVASNKFSIDGGYFFYLKHNALDKTRDQFRISKFGFEIFLHDSNEILTSEAEQENSFLEYLYLESAEDMRVILKVQTYSQISTSDNPCNPDPDYSKSKCQEECYHSQMVSEIGCTTPWFRLPKNHSYPICSNSTAMKAVITGFTKNTRKLYLQNCNCLISCNISVYQTNIVNKREITKANIPDSILALYYSSNIITSMKEVITYDWNVFLSDIGGSLGFLLGLSVISVFIVMDQLIQKICKKLFLRPDKDLNNKQIENQTKEEKTKQEEIKSDYENEKNILSYLNDSQFLENSLVNKSHNYNKY